MNDLTHPNADNISISELKETLKDVVLNWLNEKCRVNKIKFWKLFELLTGFNLICNRNLPTNILSILKQNIKLFNKISETEKCYLFVKFKEPEKHNESTVNFSFVKEEPENTFHAVLKNDNGKINIYIENEFNFQLPLSNNHSKKKMAYQVEEVINALQKDLPN